MLSPLIFFQATPSAPSHCQSETGLSASASSTTAQPKRALDKENSKDSISSVSTGPSSKPSSKVCVIS